MRYQVDILLPLKLQKISYYFGLCQKILLDNQFAGFFTFDLFDLLISIPGVHCYMVLVYKCVNQLVIVRFDDAGYILVATAAHFHCVLIKYFVKLVGGWESGDIIVGETFLQHLWRVLC